MKKTMSRVMHGFLLAIVSICLITLPGCGLTMAEVRMIVEPLAERAADKVAEKAAQEAYERARKAGFTAEDAIAVADLARSEARKLVEPLREKIVKAAFEEGVPEGEEKKKSKTGAAVLAGVMGLAQLLTGRKL